MYNSDAFALNVGREDWQKTRVADAYAAALQLQTDFKLFLSFAPQYDVSTPVFI